MARTTIFLMANLGSEILQCFSFLQKQDMGRAQASAGRAQKIIDEITKQGSSGAANEALLLRDIINDAFLPQHQYRVSIAELNDYFAPLAKRVLVV